MTADHTTPRSYDRGIDNRSDRGRGRGRGGGGRGRGRGRGRGGRGRGAEEEDGQVDAGKQGAVQDQEDAEPKLLPCFGSVTASSDVYPVWFLHSGNLSL